MYASSKELKNGIEILVGQVVFVLPALTGKTQIGITLSPVVVVCCENRLTFGSNSHML